MGLYCLAVIDDGFFDEFLKKIPFREMHDFLCKKIFFTNSKFDFFIQGIHQKTHHQ
jgi:hypothetical protein